MHVFFSGIGGAGIGPLSLVAKQAGYQVSGSDAKDTHYIDSLRQAGIMVSIGQTYQQIADIHAQNPIDWLVYSSALPKTDPNHPELKFCAENNIKATKRDEFINEILSQKNLKLLVISGTHGKTTATAMAVWLFKYFIYEADEYDRNFLSFYPELSLITGIDWDHPDIYPTRESYYEAFIEFIGQSEKTILWHADAEKLGLDAADNLVVLDEKQPQIDKVKLPGHVNRLDAWLVANGLSATLGHDTSELREALNKFPGVARRFEKIAPNLYTDYAHTPPKIRGALQLAYEIAGENVVVVYEGLHNTRQHFIKDELGSLFEGVKQLYIVPSYLAREDESLELLTPEKLLKLMDTGVRSKAATAELNEDLKQFIEHNAAQGNLVLCLSAGGGGSLDEWLRQNFRV
jgi:UDP-N-acetylmuramate--alanine ligase